MIATYNLCKKLIEVGKPEVVNANVDLYLANNRLTAAEYAQIMDMLAPQDAAAESAENTEG